MNPEPTIDAMRLAAQALRTGDARERARAIQAATDALDAAKAVALSELQISRDHELDGASTLNAWVRNELRLNAGQASALVRNVTALDELPLVAEAAVAGRISAAHVRVFVYGLKHVGLAKMREFEDVFVAVALESDPADLFEAVKHLKDVVHPDDLDDAWEKGMDKEDFQVTAVPDGCSIAATPLVRWLLCQRLPGHHHRGQAEEGHRLGLGTPRRRGHPHRRPTPGPGTRRPPLQDPG